MNIRAKTLLIVAVTSIGLLAGLYASARIIVLDGFADIEASSVQDNVRRVEGAMAAETARLDSTAGDWALWDDTYAFVQDRNQGYIDANLSASTLTNLNVNFMVFVDNSSEIAESLAVDLETGELTPLGGATLDTITSTDALYGHTGADSRVSGVLGFQDGAALVASRPIMTSADEGPIMGALVIGRHIDDAFVAGLAETTNTSISFAEISSDPAAAQAAGLEGAPAGAIAVQPADSSSINGYSVIADVSGAPALVLEISMSRDIYSQGTTTTLYLIGALLFAGLVFGAIAIMLLERLVLAPVSSLSAAVTRIGSSADRSQRIPTSGGDELGRLGAEINVMLGSIEEFHRSLEDKIHERTKDLEIANSEPRERNRQLLEARAQAATDGLTNLENHRTFQEAVRRLVPNGDESPVSLIMLDVDGFKMVNDALGHQAGDEILRSCARIFTANADGHRVYRYGGDEFAIIVTGRDLDDAEALAERLRTAVLGDAGVAARHITISLGTASYPETAGSADELIYEADAAMYAAKLVGKNVSCRWDRMPTRAPRQPSQRRSAPVR